MASEVKSKLPNLKICIDNEESGSDDDNLSLTEDPEVSIEDGEIDSRTVNVASDDKLGADSPMSEHAVDEDVQFNVYLNKLEPKRADSIFTRPTRKYENKEGNFVTGIDFLNQEDVGKRQDRAKRFGIEYKPEQAVNFEELYNSLGLKPEDLNGKDERGIRLEAIHVRGVNEMNTKDVFNYFQEFAAGGCEWIDDESCNVVWLDKVTAARAMLKLSRSYQQVMEDYGLKPPSRSKKDKIKDTNAAVPDDGEMKNTEVDGEKNEEERTEEKMEEDDDDLDLTEDRKSEEKQPEEQKEKQDEAEKMEDEGIEEGEITDDEEALEPEIPVKNQNKFNRIPWPPGKWRLGVQYKDKASYIFLRFATKADVKLPGAEQRSKYYQKYGNPNYGGVKGLLSKSMKRKLRSRMDSDGLETFGVPDSVPTDRSQISYGDDLFTDTIAPVEVEEIDIYSKPETKKDKKTKKKALSEDEDEEMAMSSDENTFPVIERMTSEKEKGEPDGSDVDEEELERLLGAKEKKPMMRMYADEIEEKQKAHRQRQMVGALTIVADAKKQVKSIQDARQLISGVDLRTALQEKKMNRQQSPDRWTRSRSPEKWQKSRSPDTWKRSRSRSVSPDSEREINGRLNFKIVTPMHMTIENDDVLESEKEEEEADVEKAEEEEEEKEEEEIREPSPEPVKEVKRKKRVPSPMGTKSKMDQVEKPRDVRSRLSKRVDVDSRDVRRSPNNVRSRLSKRVSPENISPEKDTRISRLRRSRSNDRFRSNFNRSRSRSQERIIRDRHLRGRRSRSPIRRRFNDRKRSPLRARSPIPVRTRSPIRYRSPVRTRSPVRNRSPVRRFNRSRSRSPLRRPARSNIRSRSPVNRRFSDRTRSGRDARSRLGRKSRSPTDTEESDEEEIEPSRIKMTVAASSESSDSSSISDSSSDEDSSSSNDEESSSSSSASSSSSSDSSDSSSSSSSSDEESDSNVSEVSAVQNRRTQRKQVKENSRTQHREMAIQKQQQLRKDSRVSVQHKKKRKPVEDDDL